MVKKLFSSFYLTSMFIFLYMPILILVIFSFNDSEKSMSKWKGFSLDNYVKLFDDQLLMEAVTYTFTIAIISTLVATLVGTFTAIGMYRLSKGLKSYILNVNYLPIVNPDIVTAVSLMILFISVNMEFGFVTVLASHIMFSIPFVILSVLPRLYGMNDNIAEAALDLGATPFQVITKVIIPEISTGILAGALIAFTMSIDDFVISYFTVGSELTNISIEIYNMAKKGIRLKVNALATIMVTVIFLFVVFTNLIKNKKIREV